MTDIASLINNTHREVGSRRVAAGEARTVLLRRSYDAEVQDVWEACTDPNRMNRWFLQVSGDLRPGGTYQLEGNANGEILRCEPPRRLTVTWLYPGHPAGEVELRLSPGADGDTVLELEHAIAAEYFAVEARGVGPGWEPALLALDMHLKGELPDALASEWRGGALPPEVMELIDQSGQIWSALIEAADPGVQPDDLRPEDASR
jgi:uncharacterized protein YndB with AHSA1/START domain